MMPSMDVVDIRGEDSLRRVWDTYVVNHPHSNIYQQSCWREVIGHVYGHECHYLIALNGKGAAIGILPLVHLKSFLFGHRLTSMPFFDMGGGLFDDERAEKRLVLKSVDLAASLGVDHLELRQTQPLRSFDGGWEGGGRPYFTASRIHRQKVRMLLELPESSEALMASFKSKLRSQIRKPVKEGCRVQIGAGELIDDFYTVFSVNMRDLGSPVHSKRMISQIFKSYSGDAKIVVVYKDRQPVSGGVLLGYRKTLSNPWASSLRRYSRFSPNMLLYWAMLEYGCDRGYRSFDFGRSTVGEGTFRFKGQWGAKPHPLYWHELSRKDNGEDSSSHKSHFAKAIRCWQRLPVPLTKIAGPMIRRYIDL